MIVVRNIFKLKFGMAREAIELWKEGIKLMNEAGGHSERVLTDLTGPFYTFVMESTYKNLTEYENLMSTEVRTDEWRKWYQRFVDITESGYREIYQIVQIPETVKSEKEKAYAGSRG